MFKSLLFAGLVAVAAVPAAAVTISVDQSISAPDVTFYSTTQNFVLTSGFTNAQLNIFNFTADDSAVVTVNGTPIVGVGIFGPGTGTFRFTADGPATPFTFQGNGALNTSYSAPFVVGNNVISVLVNNNNAGINPGGGGLTGGPSSVDFTGTITFDAAVVPEPATWGLLITGFAMTGLAMRRRSAAVTA